MRIVRLPGEYSERPTILPLFLSEFCHSELWYLFPVENTVLKMELVELVVAQNFLPIHLQLKLGQHFIWKIDCVVVVPHH